jgi:hypothetical protein
MFPQKYGLFGSPAKFREKSVEAIIRYRLDFNANGISGSIPSAFGSSYQSWGMVIRPVAE